MDFRAQGVDRLYRVWEVTKLPVPPVKSPCSVLLWPSLALFVLESLVGACLSVTYLLKSLFFIHVQIPVNNHVVFSNGNLFESCF